MQHHELEAWVLQIIDRVTSGQSIEDSRVELKAEWPDPKKAARQIAGHANTAHGEPILWLVGIDEKRHTVTGATETELANWYPQVKGQFDGLAPRVVDLNVPTKNRTVVALLFETDRVPFVVKNPDGGTIQFEVPWRENRATRIADRSDLMKLLSPLQLLPSVELLGAVLQVQRASAEPPKQGEWLNWNLNLAFYIVPHADSKVVIPFHRCSGLLGVVGEVEQIELTFIHMRPPGLYTPGSFDQRESLTILGTANELLVEGPGKVLFQGTARTKYKEANYEQDVEITLRLIPAGAAGAVTISRVLVHDSLNLLPKKAFSSWFWTEGAQNPSELL